MKKICSGTRCPFMTDQSPSECMCTETCEYFTQEIDYQNVIENFCDHIADLVVKKLKEEE